MFTLSVLESIANRLLETSKLYSYPSVEVLYLLSTCNSMPLPRHPGGRH